MFDLGRSARLMVRTTPHLSSSALVSVICFGTASVPAMIYLTEMAVAIMAKHRPLLRMDLSSSLICVALRFSSHLLMSMLVSVTFLLSEGLL